MLPREMRTDVMPGASGASSPADESIEAAPVPTLPTQDVLPKAVPGALSLMKPAGPFAQATQTLGGRPQPRPRTDSVAEKIKVVCRAPDEGEATRPLPGRAGPPIRTTRRLLRLSPP